MNIRPNIWIYGSQPAVERAVPDIGGGCVPLPSRRACSLRGGTTHPQIRYALASFSYEICYALIHFSYELYYALPSRRACSLRGGTTQPPHPVK